MRQAYREARVELDDLVPADGLAQILADLESEGVRLLAAKRSAGLLYDALQGKRYCAAALTRDPEPPGRPARRCAGRSVPSDLHAAGQGETGSSR